MGLARHGGFRHSGDSLGGLGESWENRICGISSHLSAPRAKQRATALTLSDLSPRQQEIIRLVVRGLSDKEIGVQLNLSHYTVKIHVALAMRKLQVHKRIELIFKLCEVKERT